MGVINFGWYANNELTGYPLDDAATGEDDSGASLPPNILADLKLVYPRTLGLYPFLASCSVSAGLVSLTFECSDDPSDRSGFSPLGVVSVARTDLNIHTHVPIQGQVAGVGGWVVFGRGAEDATGYRGRFSTPAQSRLARRACRPYRALPVTGIRDFRVATALTGVVRLRGEPPFSIDSGTREIRGVSRTVAVLRLIAESQDTSGFVVPTAAQQILASPTDNVWREFAGPCAGRPESLSCGDPQPIEFINTVAPDCTGTITIDIRGCAKVAKLGETCGIVVDCDRGLSQACLPARIANADGILPLEADPVDIPPYFPPVVPPPPPGPDESIVVVGELPYTACFDTASTPEDFVTLSGLWSHNLTDTGAENPYCHPEIADIDSLVSGFDYGSLESISASAENIILWQGFDVSTLGRKVITSFKLTAGPTGAKHAAGLILNRRPHTANAGQFVHFTIEIDYDTQEFRLRRFNGSNYQTIVTFTLPGILLETWYTLWATIEPGTSAGQVSITMRLVGIGDPLTATVGPVTLTNYAPSNGFFGLWANRTQALYSYFRVEQYPPVSTLEEFTTEDGEVFTTEDGEPFTVEG